MSQRRCILLEIYHKPDYARLRRFLVNVDVVVEQSETDAIKRETPRQPFCTWAATHDEPKEEQMGRHTYNARETLFNVA